jgi:plastocyanin
MIHLRVLALGFGICVVIGVIACGNGVPQTSTSSGPPIGSVVQNQTATTMIQATDQLTFAPEKASVHVGDVVEWVNNGTVTHTVTFNDHTELNDDTLAPNGGVWQIKFTLAGTYPYICTIHQPGMVGTITVT